MEKDKDLETLLSNNCVIAKLTVKIWSGKKTDQKAGAEFTSSKGAVTSAATVVKKLLAGNDAKLKETISAYTSIRSYFYENSSPWTTTTIGAMKGDRLVGTVASIQFLSKFAKLKQSAEDVLSEFLDEYDTLVQGQAVSMGSLYDLSQYPTKLQIAGLFGASIELRPVPNISDFDRISIPGKLVQGLKDLHMRSTRQQMTNALSDIQGRILHELERMDTQLSKVANGQKTRLFKSMVDNLRHLVGMARSLNLVDNQEIENIATAIENNLLKYEVDDYKDNAALAGATVAKAREIVKAVNNDDAWKVDDGGELTGPTVMETAAEIVGDTVEEKAKDPEVSAEIESDLEFLASLATPIEIEAEDETPDFDPDAVFYSQGD